MARLWLLWSVALGGCYDWVALRPSEATRLNVDPGLSDPERRERARVPMHVEGTDGAMKAIRGDFDLRIRTRGGVRTTVSHPVSIERAGADLVFRGGDGSVTRVAESDIAAMEVEQFDQRRTGVVAAAVFAATVVIGTYLYFNLQRADRDPVDASTRSP